MPTIVIKRSSEYVNKLRAIDLYLDGEKVGNITDEEKKVFEVPEGAHQLTAKIDWCGSPDVGFEIKDGEEQFFQLSSFKKIQRFIMLFFVLGAILFVTNVFLRNGLLMDVTVGIFSIAVLMIVYMVTINRNNYLSLTRVDNN